MEAKVGMYEGIVEPTLLYGCEAWTLNVHERKEGERLVRRVYGSDARGMRGRGRPRKCWIDGTKEVMRRKGFDSQEARVCVQDRNEWRSICRGDRRAVGGLPVYHYEAALSIGRGLHWGLI